MERKRRTSSWVLSQTGGQRLGSTVSVRTSSKSREALEERVPIQTRDAPDGSGGGGTGQGEAFWLDIHVQYLPKPYQFAV
jgi:hypothetical protein